MMAAPEENTNKETKWCFFFFFNVLSMNTKANIKYCITFHNATPLDNTNEKREMERRARFSHLFSEHLYQSNLFQ